MPAHVRYTWNDDGGCIRIIDESGEYPHALTVTNGVEEVLRQLKARGADFRKPVIYRDSEGRWDGITATVEGVFQGFYPLGMPTEALAAAAAIERARHAPAETDPRFTLSIELSNDAFCDDNGKPEPERAGVEIARLLRVAAHAIIGAGPMLGTLRDTNGNTVGKWEIRL